jgi:hypothetical protein
MKIRKWYLPAATFLVIATSAPIYIERIQIREVRSNDTPCMWELCSPASKHIACIISL